MRPDSNVGVYCYSTRDFSLAAGSSSTPLLPCPPRRARAFCPLLLARLLPRQWPRFLHLRPAINHRVRHGQTSHPHPPVPHLAVPPPLRLPPSSTPSHCGLACSRCVASSRTPPLVAIIRCCGWVGGGGSRINLGTVQIGLDRQRREECAAVKEQC